MDHDRAGPHEPRPSREKVEAAVRAVKRCVAVDSDIVDAGEDPVCPPQSREPLTFAYAGVVELTVEAVLQTVRDFETASLGLLAWEFSVREDSLRSLWNATIGEGLLTAAGTDPDTGEAMYAVSELGDQVLEALRTTPPSVDLTGFPVQRSVCDDRRAECDDD